MDLRGHVLDDAVDKVKALVVVSLGGDELLKNSEQTRLRGKDKCFKYWEKQEKALNPALTYYFICSRARNRRSPLLQESLKQPHQRGDVSCPFPQDGLEQVWE